MVVDDTSATCLGCREFRIFNSQWEEAGRIGRTERMERIRSRGAVAHHLARVGQSMACWGAGLGEPDAARPDDRGQLPTRLPKPSIHQQITHNIRSPVTHTRQTSCPIRHAENGHILFPLDLSSPVIYSSKNTSVLSRSRKSHLWRRFPHSGFIQQKMTLAIFRVGPPPSQQTELSIHARQSRCIAKPRTIFVQ